MSYPDITPMSLADDLLELIQSVDKGGYIDVNKRPVRGVNLLLRSAIIDDSKAWMRKDVTSTPIAGVAYVGSMPADLAANAGLETLTFVILVAVESSTSANSDARKAQSLLYHLQAAIHGRPASIGRPWKWAGHNMVLDDGNEGFQVYQQTWQLLHGFNGYSGQ